MTKARSILALFILSAAAATATPLAARETPSYPYGYLSHVEGEVTLQRATEAEPEEGALNVPVMPGDRLWTPSRSRAEIAFADGTRVRVDESTKLDVVEAEAELLLRVWSGSIIVSVEDETVPIRIDTPSGSVFPAGPGLYRVDLDGERLALSVTRGSAELAATESSVIVGAGETAETIAGTPSRPYAFNTARLDAFGQFSESLDADYRAGNDVVVKSLPHEVHYYARDLHHHGEWYREPDYGWVWYPQVSIGWAPYRQGRWQYTRFGYTWVSYEPWGWAPYHYGRWGYGHRGWYWIPGTSWSPAWVSFAFGPSWVGWSPIGFHGRAVFGFDSVFYPKRRYRGGHAVPRHVYDDGAGWNFVGRQQFTARSGRARLRASQVQASADSARLFDSGTVLGRDLRPYDRATRATATTASRRGRAVERRYSGSTSPRSDRVQRELTDRARAAQAQRSRLNDLADSQARSRSRSRDSSETRSSNAGPTARSRYGSNSRDTRATDPRADRSAWRERATGESTNAGRGRSSGSATRTRSRAETPARERNQGSSRTERYRPSGSSSAWRERARGDGSSSNGRVGERTRSRGSEPPPATTRDRTNRSGSQTGRSTRSYSDRFDNSRSRSRSARPEASAPSRSRSGSNSSGARSSVGSTSRSNRGSAAGAGAGAGSGSRSGAAKARRRKN